MKLRTGSGVLALAVAVLVASLTVANFVFAEGTAQPGPHAANFKLLNNGSGIDQYTGSYSWRQTLLTVPGRGGLDFPVTLTYNGGIGVEQEASWVGLGFGLNLGSIERSVVYIPDDMVLYHKYGTAIHQHDGWLFDDNYEVLPQVHSGIRDSQFTDGPDMWTVALSELGANMSIFADSANIFRQAGTPYGPAGKNDRAVMLSANAPWASKYQRAFGLAVRVGATNYNPDSLDPEVNNERQRHCYVSPPMGSTVQGRYYNYSGEIKLIFNDTTNGYGNDSGGCSVYVYKYTNATSTWSKAGPFVVKGDSAGWKPTGVSVSTNDRFAILCKSRKFEFEKWQPVKVDYEVEFSDWGGYYVNPESYSDPYDVFHQGVTPRIKSFTLTDKGGKAYVFGTSDWIQATSRKPEYYTQYDNVIEDTMSVCFSSSFKLTSVLSSDYVDADEDGVPSDSDLGSWVKLVYDSAVRINFANKPLKAFDAVFHRFGGVVDYSPVWQWHYIRYPKYVETPTHKAYFYLSPRRDNWGVNGLDSDSTLRPRKLDSLVLFAKTPTGQVRERRVSWRYANAQTQPTSFTTWQDGQTLGWHTTPEGSVGKLTLLEVKEFATHDGDSLPGIRFTYTTNPQYTEQQAFGDVNDNVDFYCNDQYCLSRYRPGYQENWGYYRTSVGAIPGLDQQAWSLKSVSMPEGAKETVEWESNKYLWWETPGSAPGGDGLLQYRSEYVDEGDGAQRGGVRVKSRRLDGGLGSDSALEYTYGEGVATKPQTPSRKAARLGRIGNSQEVGYRSAVAHLKGESANTRVLTKFTNGAAAYPAAAYNDGQTPSPAIDARESFRDNLEYGVSPTCYILDGVKRGLSYEEQFFNSNGNTVKTDEQVYSFSLKASKDVISGWTYGIGGHDGRARSIWVRQTQTKTQQFDENGQNPVLLTTLYDYDTLNGLITTQTDSLGSGVARKNVTEYLHTQSAALDTLLRRRNLLDLVYKQEVQKDGGGNVVESRSMFDYKDFGNGRVYPWHRYDYRKISPAEVETTTYAAYDKFGNPRLVVDPSGTKTAYLAGYSGAMNVLIAPNADTAEVAYNGIEDSVGFDGWGVHGAVQTSARSYSGKYSAIVNSFGNYFGPNKVIPAASLTPNKKYVFSGWVYTTGTARLSVDFQGMGGGPDTAESIYAGTDWRRVEIVFTFPQGATGLECYTSSDSDTSYFDDLRIHPVDCPMQTFVYDRATMQLAAAFDANNIAGERYFYDGFGRLSKVLNPAGNTVARYEYVYSRVGSGAFDPKNPNAVKEIRYRSSTAGDSNVTVTYYDGLGREVQKQVAINSNSKVLSAMKYNGAGQLIAQAKPIEKSASLGSMPFDTTFLPSSWTVGSALSSGDLHTYYDSDGPGANCNGYPYMQISYSTDPLRRITETGYPDATWKLGSGNTTRLNYFSNGSSDAAGWAGRTLIKTKTRDEGEFISFQYADRLGRIVQAQIDSGESRCYYDTVAFPGGPDGVYDTILPYICDTTRIRTRYSYDIRGNQTRIIRQQSVIVNDTLSFAYDALGRLTYEKSPDAGGIHYVYDKSGNLRFKMDSARAVLDKFIYYKYDALNRKIEEGLYTDIDSMSQAHADQASFPTTGGSIQFSFRYDSTGGFTNYGRGRLASWNSGSAFYRRMAYDELGRVYSENVKVDSTTILNYSYDWQGNVKTFYVQTKSVFPQVYYKYDMANRLIGVGTSSAPYRYDSLLYWPWGGLKTQVFKTTASTVGQTVDYTYNPRDWLVRINDTGSVSGSTSGNGDHFALQLGYGRLFNGDIDSIQFKHSGQSVSREKMSYDAMRRLARWHPGLTSDTTGDEIYQYDWAGNVLYWKLGGTTNGYSHTYWPGTNRLKKIGTSADYTYDASGHIASEPGRSFGPEYRNITSHVTIPKGNWNNYLDFWYDADLQRIKKHFDAGYNCTCGPVEMIQPGDPEELESSPKREGSSRGALGNLSASAKGGSDPRIPSFPEEVEDSTVIRVSGIGGDSCICRTATTILYIHSYDGRVVREYVNGAAQRDYLYAGSNRIGVSEKTGSSYKLRYYLTDHLGSTRQTIDSSGLMESRLDYYPYGTTRPGALVSYNTRIRYTGKVLDDEDINQTYYGARYLNGVTNRFNSVDPLQGKYPGWSPYAYSLCNPIRLKDTDGKGAADVIAGIVDAALNNLTMGAYQRTDYQQYVQSNRQDFLAGQLVGDAVSYGVGLLTTIAGAGGVGVSVAGVPATGGASLAVSPAAAAVSAYGVGLIGKSAAGMGTTLARMGESGQSSKQGTEGIYQAPAASGKTYVGQSQDAQTRLGQHVNSGKITPEGKAAATITEVKGGKTAREIAEQKLIDRLGGLKKLENKRNPIGEKRKELLKGDEKP